MRGTYTSLRLLFSIVLTALAREYASSMTYSYGYYWCVNLCVTWDKVYVMLEDWFGH